MRIKSSLALLGASTLLMAIAPVSALAQAPTAKTLEALTLSDAKVSDAVEISALWAKKVGKADHVLVTTDAVFADSLASGALQGNLNAPLLFVDAKAGLDSQTTKTITELGASKVTILGGMAAIPSSLVSALEKVPGVKTVDRIQGESRVETSVAIAKKTGAKDNTVIVARADDYADSLAAGALAAKTGYPVLLTTNPYKGVGADGKEMMVDLHPAVAAYLKDAGTKKVLVAGGSAAVADDTVKAIKALVNDTTRVAGETRRETAVALAKLWNSQGKVTVIDGFASSNGFQNGFAAALASARLGAPLILSNKGNELLASEKALIGPNAAGVTGYCGTYVDAGICKQVATAQGAAVKTVTLTEGKSVLPLKTTPEDVSTLNADAKKPVSRLYEVTGASPNVDYTITLAEGKKDEKGNYVLDLGKDGKHQLTRSSAGFGVVNGAVASNGVDPVATTTVKAVDGRITFSVEAKDPNAFGIVIPVITAKDGNTTKIVGQGGAVSVWPEEFKNGYISDLGNNLWLVSAVDKEAKAAVISEGHTHRTIRFYPNDEFFDGLNQPTSRITYDQFLKNISVGDGIAGDAGNGHLSDSSYHRSPTVPSQLVLANLAPSLVTARLSDKTPPTQDSITLSLTGVATGATVTVKAAKTNGAGLGYEANEDQFSLTRTFSSLTLDSARKAEVTITGLDPDTKYDFAIAQTLGEETTRFNDFGQTVPNGLPNIHWIATTKKPVPLAVASIERNEDKVNDGVDIQQGGEAMFKVTLSTDIFAGANVGDQSIDISKMRVVAKTGGTVQVQQAVLADKELTLTLLHPLRDSIPDVTYTLHIDQGALKTKAEKDGVPAGSPNGPAEFSFNYR